MNPAEKAELELVIALQDEALQAAYKRDFERAARLAAVVADAPNWAKKETKQ